MKKPTSIPPGTALPRGITATRWPLVPARELFELKYGKALVADDRQNGSIPVYGTNGQCGNHDKPLFSGPGVILGRKGQGPLGVEWSESDYWVIDTAYSLVPLRPDVDLRFAYFLIKFVGLNHLKDGTSNPTLSRDTFGAQAFPLPPLPVQKEIGQMLSSLDEKIALNRRLCATLEAMARALFKSWFVDFEPVRAKATGKATGLPKEIEKLFPAEMAENEGVGVPEGWKRETLLAISKLNPESWTTNNRPGMLQYVDLSNVKWGRIENISFVSSDAAPSRAQRVLREGDTIFGTVRPANGSYALVAEAGLTGSTGFAVLRPSRPEYRELLFLAATAGDNVDRLGHLADGGAYPAIRPDVVATTPLVLAPDEIVDQFSLLVAPMIDRIAACNTESQQLAQKREDLLPKLLSGELRVA